MFASFSRLNFVDVYFSKAFMKQEKGFITSKLNSSGWVGVELKLVESFLKYFK